MRLIFKLSFFLICIQSFLIGQIPQTNLFLFDMHIDAENNYHVINGKYLSSFNSGGYNNQPYFISDKECLISVQLEADSQTDIYMMNIERWQLYRMTKTPESEYSPTLMPDQKNFSCIQQSNDSSANQLLWKYPINRSSTGSAIFKDITNVGYHAWINKNTLALFLVGDQNSLGFINIRDKELKTFTNNIGRGLRKNKRGSLIFLQKKDENSFYIKEYDPLTEKARIIAETPGKTEDFALTSDGSLIMAVGAKLYKYKLGFDKEWTLFADLSLYGLINISRIAINKKNQIIVVDNP